jgi:hypothetical protein
MGLLAVIVGLLTDKSGWYSATAKLTKILANFSLHLTSVFNGFVLITPTKIYSSSTRTLYDNQASKNVGALVDAGGGVDAPFLFSFNI